MDELKDIYGVEMTELEKKIIASIILSDEYRRMDKMLAKTTDISQRYYGLQRQEALKYLASLIGDVNETD